MVTVEDYKETLLTALDHYINNPTIDLDECEPEEFCEEVVRLIGTRFSPAQVELMTFEKFNIIEVPFPAQHIDIQSIPKRYINGINVIKTYRWEIIRFMKDGCMHRENGPAERLPDSKNPNVYTYNYYLNGKEFTPLEYAEYLRDKGVLEVSFDFSLMYL